MYNTKEIRWFSSRPSSFIMDWFNKQGLTFDSVNQRNDIYLNIKNESVGIKLRDGHLEIKHRIGKPTTVKLTNTIKGHFKEWNKWRIKADETDSVFSELAVKNHQEWIAKKKERIGLKLYSDKGSLKTTSIDWQGDFGCQIEYSRIHIKDKTWYTFGLEWFGHEFLNLDSTLISEITGETNFRLRQSMGYPTFLSLKKIT
ncbi:hypothetical protein JQC67_07075 [Aurantibacter crassamenti]|uniref:hypothetical protein n=1 Tax=Aurantibacter crassamenti TaxID=1837375 RepID=UPI00193AB1BE|nr:hypothetical protein [Aurantibacter crassamenti]MBM1105893.1 hypothetical protein [Aurantibacter crassamenti]